MIIALIPLPHQRSVTVFLHYVIYSIRPIKIIIFIFKSSRIDLRKYILVIHLIGREGELRRLFWLQFLITKRQQLKWGPQVLVEFMRWQDQKVKRNDDRRFKWQICMLNIRCLKYKSVILLRIAILIFSECTNQPLAFCVVLRV